MTVACSFIRSLRHAKMGDKRLTGEPKHVAIRSAKQSLKVHETPHLDLCRLPPNLNRAISDQVP